MTIKSTIAAIKALPYMTARWSSDAEDALETAKAMSRTEAEMRGDNRPH